MSLDAPITSASDGVVWRYVVRMTSKQVLHEALYRKKERFSYVFVRDWDEASRSYLIKQQDFGFNPTEASKVRPNASLIATLPSTASRWLSI